MSRQALFAKLVAFARDSHENEEGSSMVFGAITLFTLALFTMTVYVIGMNSGDRLQNQTAADSAAYSGALVEAEALESIAFLNDGMSYVYYTECRYAIDAIVYSTLRAFYEHDVYVNQKSPNRVYPNVNSPGQPVEFSVGPGHNNPGARAGQNYTPGIEPGGNIPPGQTSNANQPQDYGFVEMGSSGGNGDRAKLFEERYSNAIGRAKFLLPRGKRWLSDINAAERVILYATPQLVKKTAIDVALKNGAEWVAVSSDVDDVFEITAKNQDAGFTDGSEQGGNLVNGGMVRRYTDDKSNPIDKKAQRMPSWFNALAGNIAQDYQQVRLCWNKRDWDHCEVQGNYSEHQGYPFTQGAPAGHWHVAHLHGIDVLDPQTGGVQDTYYVYGEQMQGGPFTHDYGHGIMGGPDSGQHAVPSQTNLTPGFNTAIENGWARFAETDMSDPGAEHHAAQTCPTCAAQGSEWAEVTHDFNDGGKWVLQQRAGLNPDDLTTVHFGQGETMPRPLLLKGRALRAGVSVATWRKSRGFTTEHLAPNDFGDFAIASAQVGLRDPLTNTVFIAQSVDDSKAVYVGTNGGTRQVALNAGAGNQGSDNFFLGSGEQGEPGLRFGARLVPVRRELTWSGVNAAAGGAAASGLSNLLYGSRWWSQVPNGAISRDGTRPGANDDLGKALQNLRAFINVAQSPKAFAQ